MILPIILAITRVITVTDSVWPNRTFEGEVNQAIESLETGAKAEDQELKIRDIKYQNNKGWKTALIIYDLHPKK